jgi:hypothetical protein
LQEIQESDFDLSLTGFDPGEIDGLLALEDDEKATPRRRCLKFQSPVRAIFGCSGSIGSYAAIRPARRSSRDYLEIASRASWSPIRPMGSSWIPNGVIALDSMVMGRPSQAT